VAVGVVPAAGPGVPPADLELLQPLLAAQAEALSAELQAIFAARLEVVFKPLQDLVAAVDDGIAVVSPDAPPVAEQATILYSASLEVASTKLEELIKPACRDRVPTGLA
jgi:hypothetical protein